MSSNARTKLTVGSIAAVGAAALIVVGLTVPSGATFNDTKPAHVTISTATLALGVSDADNSGTIDIGFNNLKPGQLISQSFNVRNDGTIPATATLGSAFTNSTPGVAGLDYNQLRIGVGTVSGQNALTSVLNMPATWDLGVLQPGQQKTFVVDVKLGASAGNEWQGQTFGGDLPVVLTQQ